MKLGKAAILGAVFLLSSLASVGASTLHPGSPSASISPSPLVEQVGKRTSTSKCYNCGAHHGGMYKKNICPDCMTKSRNGDKTIRMPPPGQTGYGKPKPTKTR